MFRKFFAISFFFLLIAGQALCQQASYVTSSTVTMETDGSNPTGTVNLQTNNAGRIQFFTNRTLRGYIDGTTGALEGFPIGSTATFTTLTGTATPSNIFTNANSKYLILAGGTSASSANGASVYVGGLTSALPGQILMQGGQVATGNIISRLTDNSAQIQLQNSSAANMWTIDNAGVLAQNGTNGSDIVINKTASLLRAGTTDGADNIAILLNGGGGAGTVRGSQITLWGNEGAGAGVLGLTAGAAGAAYITLDAPDAAGYIRVRTGASLLERWRFNASGQLVQDATNGGNIQFNKTGSAVNWNAITGYITTSGTNPIEFQTNSLARWTMNGSTGALTQDATNGGSIVLLKASTWVAQPNVTGVTATGTTIADAFQLSAVYTEFSTVAAGTGAKLFAMDTGSISVIKNSGANALLLYPSTGSGTINRGAAGASVSIAAGATAYCFYSAGLSWMCGEMPAA